MNNVVAIVQTRLESTRLPGKALADICGKPMLQRVVERVQQAKLVDRVVVATTPTMTHLLPDTWYYIGSETDVLDRVYRAAEPWRPRAVVRITGDCPMIDPRVIDLCVARFLEGGFDYASNCYEPSFPDGLDCEVIDFHALRVAWREATLPSDREHVTPFLWRQPQRFRLANVLCEPSLAEHRWCVDTAADLEFVRAVYAELGDDFTTADVLALLERRPELREINAGGIRNEAFIQQMKGEGG